MENDWFINGLVENLEKIKVNTGDDKSKEFYRRNLSVM